MKKILMISAILSTASISADVILKAGNDPYYEYFAVYKDTPLTVDDRKEIDNSSEYPVAIKNEKGSSLIGIKIKKIKARRRPGALNPQQLAQEPYYYIDLSKHADNFSKGDIDIELMYGKLGSDYTPIVTITQEGQKLEPALSAMSGLSSEERLDLTGFYKKEALPGSENTDVRSRAEGDFKKASASEKTPLLKTGSRAPLKPLNPPSPKKPSNKGKSKLKQS